MVTRALRVGEGRKFKCETVCQKPLAQHAVLARRKAVSGREIEALDVAVINPHNYRLQGSENRT